MPGMSGWQVAQEVKKKAKGVSVVMVTGWGLHGDEKKAGERYVDLIINKPFTMETIHGAVDKALRKRNK